LLFRSGSDGNAAVFFFNQGRVDFLKLMIQSQISEDQAKDTTSDQPVKGLRDCTDFTHSSAHERVFKYAVL